MFFKASNRLEYFRACSLTGAAMGAAVFLACPSYAQVMEISPEGIVSVRDGSGEALWEIVNDHSEPAEETKVQPEVPADAITSVGLTSIPARYREVVQRAAVAAGISPALLSALVWQESRWNPAAVSPKGAVGLTQLMPGTARDLGVDPRNPVANLHGGAQYFRRMLDSFDGDVEKALAAYNAGPGRVIKANGIPRIRETQAYVASVVQRVSSTAFRGEK